MNTYFANSALHAWIDLDTLLRDFQLGLVVVAGSDADTGSQPVQWVHSSDLADPTPFLTPRTVLLTTGAQFKGTLSKKTAENYVASLVAGGTTALGVGVGIRWDRIPPALVEACERLGLPLIRVPYDTPFIAITRAAGRLIDSAMHAQNVDRFVTAGPSSGRVTHARQVARAEAGLRAAVIRLLIAGERELAEQIADPLLPRLPRGQVAVLALPPRAFEQEALGDGSVAGTLDGTLLIVAEPAALGAAKRLVQGTPAGLSERGALGDLPELVTQARRALEHAINAADEAEAGGARPKLLVEYRPAMHAGLLQLIGESQDARRRASGFLSPIRAHDERHGDEIELSLETWLKHNGQLSPAATELGIHRHTLRTRIRTAASLLQRDIDSPDTRTELWAALRIVHPRPTPTPRVRVAAMQP